MTLTKQEFIKAMAEINLAFASLHTKLTALETEVAELKSKPARAARKTNG